MKKKVIATRMIAATETRISVVAWDFVFCFGSDDGDATLAAGAEGSAAGTAAACGTGSCGSGGVVESLTGGTMLGGVSLGWTMRVEAFPDGIGVGGTGLASARVGLGALGRGT